MLRHVVRLLFLSLVLLMAAVATGHAEALSGKTLIDALRNGGYTIYFRHAATDWSNDDKVEKAGDWKSCDPARMRQLSEAGRAAARRIGDAIRTLRIPVGKVISSEYCRSAETARQMKLGQVRTTPDIMNMRSAEFVGGRDAVVRRARRVMANAPTADANAVIVGHGNLMRAATEAYAREGGAGIYRPDPNSEIGLVLVARLAPEEWTALAERFAAD